MLWSRLGLDQNVGIPVSFFDFRMMFNITVKSAEMRKILDKSSTLKLLDKSSRLKLLDKSSTLEPCFTRATGKLSILLLKSHLMLWF